MKDKERLNTNTTNMLAYYLSMLVPIKVFFVISLACHCVKETATEAVCTMAFNQSIFSSIATADVLRHWTIISSRVYARDSC